VLEAEYQEVHLFRRLLLSAVVEVFLLLFFSVFLEIDIFSHLKAICLILSIALTHADSISFSLRNRSNTAP
jgi:hypothetical protein